MMGCVLGTGVAEITSEKTETILGDKQSTAQRIRAGLKVTTLTVLLLCGHHMHKDEEGAVLVPGGQATPQHPVNEERRSNA